MATAPVSGGGAGAPPPQLATTLTASVATLARERLPSHAVSIPRIIAHDGAARK
jgi:hypothetical protein